MERWFDVIESRHEIQNPTSAEKIELLGERAGLGPNSRVLDLGSGRGGPAVMLARVFGCHVTCVERSAAFVAAAHRAISDAGVESLVDVVHSDAREFPIEADRFDAALCLGASFIWGGLEQTVTALHRGVRAGGCVAVGDVYWRAWPLPDGFEPGEDFDFAPLAETVTRFESGDVNLVALITSSRDDWDRYESLHWHALEEWLNEHAEDPDAERFREMGRKERDDYLHWHRDLMGWGIFVGRTR